MYSLENHNTSIPKRDRDASGLTWRTHIQRCLGSGEDTVHRRCPILYFIYGRRDEEDDGTLHERKRRGNREYKEISCVCRSRQEAEVPSQNGVAERFNRTLMELARAMIIAKNLPPFLWTHAVQYAAYLRNRVATRALEGKTPHEAWTGKKPDVSHLEQPNTSLSGLRTDRKR